MARAKRFYLCNLIPLWDIDEENMDVDWSVRQAHFDDLVEMKADIKNRKIQFVQADGTTPDSGLKIRFEVYESDFLLFGGLNDWMGTFSSHADYGDKSTMRSVKIVDDLAKIPDTDREKNIFLHWSEAAQTLQVRCWWKVVDEEGGDISGNPEYYYDVFVEGKLQDGGKVDLHERSDNELEGSREGSAPGASEGSAPRASEGSAPGPDPEVSTAGPLVGEPDYAPQYTFIAEATPGDNGFINLAVQFHQNSGLNPITVRSIEEIVDLLDDPTQTGRGILTRIRIVSHIFFDPNGIQNPTNMMLRFLTAGVRPSLSRHFEGFTGTSMDALKSMMTFEVKTFTNTTHFIYRDPASKLMSFLGPAHNDTLKLVPVDDLGEPTGEFNDFFKICGSKWVLQRGAISDTSVTSTLQQAYDILLTDIVSRIGSPISESNLNILRDAIIDFGSNHDWNSQTPHNPTEYGKNVSATLTAIQNNNFLQKLNRVRQRFNRNSKIDIRGCQVGRDRGFLQAVQRFFGTNATVRPAVSGPQWFQHFNQIGAISPQGNGAIVTLFNKGRKPYSATQIQQFFDTWATGFGITSAHMSFWQTTLGLNALTFSALQWQTGIPMTTIPIARLQALTTANFRDVIARLANIFLTPNANLPSNEALAQINSFVSNLGTWATQLNATVPDTSTPTQLTSYFNNLKTIYENVDNRFTGSSGPPADKRIIPATPSSPIKAQTIRKFQTDLKKFIDIDSNSRFQPIKRFLNATLAMTQDPPARMRYFLCLGLPFLVYDPAATIANRNFIVVFEDTIGLAADRRQNDAVKYWIRAQWRGIIPSGLGAGTTFNNSLHTPWLVENRQPTANLTVPPFVVSPTVEFHQRIVLVNS